MNNPNDTATLLTDTYNYYGKKPAPEIQPREAKKEPTPRVGKARERYFETRSSASVEFPYWYTRRWDRGVGMSPKVWAM